MNTEYLSQWRKDVRNLQEVERTLDNDREILYGELANKIKKIFADNDNPTENVHFSKDGTTITVTLEKHPSIVLKLPHELISELGMSFAIVRRITERGDTELVVELYPLEDC